MEDTMDILHFEMKGPLIDTLEPLNIYSLSKENLHINDTYADTYNPIFNLIKEHYTKNTIQYPHPTQLFIHTQRQHLRDFDPRVTALTR
jgi:hypothetical protein